MFVGYFTIYGPNGYIEASTKEAVEAALAPLLEKYPHAMSGKIRQNWFWTKSPKSWRVTIWSRLELVGN
jgi:hypothetical protein